jgi:chromosome segregation ATPase
MALTLEEAVKAVRAAKKRCKEADDRWMNLRRETEVAERQVMDEETKLRAAKRELVQLATGEP